MDWTENPWDKRRSGRTSRPFRAVWYWLLRRSHGSSTVSPAVLSVTSKSERNAVREESKPGRDQLGRKSA